MKSKMLFLAMASLSAVAMAQTEAQAPSQGSAATRLAEGKVDKDQLASNMESTSKLLESSSAARQIVLSKEPGATSRHERAKEIFKTAKAALDSGDLPKAARLLGETRSVFFEAVRLAAPQEVAAKSLESGFQGRMDSVKSLLAAYKRVANEKGNVKDVDKTTAAVEKHMANAASMAQAGNAKEARDELDRGYLVAKVALSGARSGDTLVRSLNFASKEEEYNYELDRNNTHQLLIKAFVGSEKRSDSMVVGFLAKAQELRTQAEAAAMKKDHAEAVKLLEQSTSELVRAIRNAGIYIPG